jgi:hypothetical protein
MGGILDRAIQVFRERFLLFAGLAIFPGFAQLAEEIASVHPKTATDPSGAHIALVVASYGASFVFWVAHLLLEAIASAAICLAASKVLFEEETTIRSAFGAFTSKGGPLVWLKFLQGLYAGWPFIIVGFIFFFMSLGTGALARDPYMIVSIVILGSIPSIALYVRYALAFPATAIEDLTAHSAIDRSISLGEGGRWRICGGFLFPGVAAAGFGLCCLLLIARLQMVSPLLAGNPVVVAGLSGIVTLVGAVVFTPVSVIVLTVLYYDQRIRREGYDIERMMDAAGLIAPAPPPAGESPIASVSSISEEGRL